MFKRSIFTKAFAMLLVLLFCFDAPKLVLADGAQGGATPDEIITALVHFDANGGVVSTTETTVIVGKAYGGLPTPTLEGHLLRYWEGPGGRVVKPYTIVSTDTEHTLKAIWMEIPDPPITYEITFSRAVSGTLSMGKKTVTVGQPYGELAITTLPGHRFVGWYTQAGGKGDLITADTPVIELAEHILHPMFNELPRVDISLDANGGTLSNTSVTRYVGDVYGQIPTPTKKGYTFKGWYNNAGALITSSTSVTEVNPHALTAQWEIVYTSVEVTFNANGGNTPSPSKKTVQYGSTYGSLAYSSREGYSLQGWYYNGNLVSEGSSVAVETNHVLTAEWYPNKYTVYFDYNGGYSYGYDNDRYNSSATVIYGEAYGWLPEPSSYYYYRDDEDREFQGWYTKPSGGNEVKPGTRVTTAYNHTLYARWKDAGSSSPTSSSQRYTLYLDVNGGDKLKSIDVSYRLNSTELNLPTPTRSDYKFKGWFTEIEGGSEVKDGSKLSAKVNTLYARWEFALKQGKFRLDANTGELVELAKTEYVYTVDRQLNIQLPTPTKYKCVFSGWYTKAVGGTKIESWTIMPEGINVLYAHWEFATFDPLFTGYGDGTIRPDGKITNAETAVIVFRLVSDVSKYTSVPPVTNDVAQGQWYTHAVNYLVKNNIMSVDANNNFYPNRVITRAEFVNILAKWAKLNKPKTPVPFLDIPEEYRYYDSILAVREAGWVNGYPDNTFRPDNTITRAEVAVVFNAVNNVQIKADELKAFTTAFTDLPVTHWAYAHLMYATNRVLPQIEGTK